MKKHCAENEHIKRRYFTFWKEARRNSEPTVDAAAKALNRFEVYTKFRDFKAFPSNRQSRSRGTLQSRRDSSPGIN